MKFDKIIPHCKRGACMPKPEAKPDVVHVLQRIVCPCDIDTMAPGKSLAEIAPLCGTWTIAKSDGIPQGILLMSVNSDKSKVIQTKYDTDIITGEPTFYSRSADVYKSMCGEWSVWKRLNVGGGGDGIDANLANKLMDEVAKAIAKAEEAKSAAASVKGLADEAKEIADDASSDASGARSLADRAVLEVQKLKTGVGDPAGIATGMNAGNLVSAINWLYDNRGAGTTPGTPAIIPADVARLGHVDTALLQAKGYADDITSVLENSLGNAINVQAKTIQALGNDLSYTKTIAESNKAAIAALNNNGFKGYQTITEYDKRQLDINTEGADGSASFSFADGSVSLYGGKENEYTNEMTLDDTGVYVSTSEEINVAATDGIKISANDLSLSVAGGNRLSIDVGGMKWNNTKVALASDVSRLEKHIEDDIIGDLTDINVSGDNIVDAINSVYDYAKNNTPDLSDIKTFGRMFGNNNVAVEATSGGKDVYFRAPSKYGINTTSMGDQIVVQGVAVAEGMECGMMTLADKKKLDDINLGSIKILEGDILEINGARFQLTRVPNEPEDPYVRDTTYGTPQISATYIPSKIGYSGGSANLTLNITQAVTQLMSDGSSKTTYPVVTDNAVLTFAPENGIDVTFDSSTGRISSIPENPSSSSRLVGRLHISVSANGKSAEKDVAISQDGYPEVKDVWYGSYGDNTGNLTQKNALAEARSFSASQLKSVLKSTTYNSAISDTWNRASYFVVFPAGKYSNVKITATDDLGTMDYTIADGGVKKSAMSTAEYDIYFITAASVYSGSTQNVKITLS